MKNDVIRICCPKCLETSDFEFPIDKIVISRDDFENKISKSYQKGKADKCIEELEILYKTLHLKLYLDEISTEQIMYTIRKYIDEKEQTNEKR